MTRFYVISEMPPGRWATDPGKEFSEEEITALEEGGLDLSPQEAGPDPLARTAAKYVAMLASALPTKEAAEALEVGESRVRQRLREGTLYGVKAGRENRLPVFQFEGGKEVPGIAKVLKHVDRSLHPVAVLNRLCCPILICSSTKKKQTPSPRGTGCSLAAIRRSLCAWRRNSKAVRWRSSRSLCPLPR